MMRRQSMQQDPQASKKQKCLEAASKKLQGFQLEMAESPTTNRHHITTQKIRYHTPSCQTAFLLSQWSLCILQPMPCIQADTISCIIPYRQYHIYYLHPRRSGPCLEVLLGQSVTQGTGTSVRSVHRPSNRILGVRGQFILETLVGSDFLAR